MRADLHIHTYFSDGQQTPEDVALTAKANGVALVSVTDHDTMLSYPQTLEICAKYGIKAVTGIEISAYSDGVKIHTLGYGLNYESDTFKAFHEELVDASFERTADILNKLKKGGIILNFDDVLSQRRCNQTPIHAMYIARAGAKKGYAGNPYSFYASYLNKGTCGYSDVRRPSPEKAIEIIKACGGFASIAHPGRIDMEKQQLIALVKRLCGCGLEGIEAVYSTHTLEETAYFKGMASQFKLVVTGGSDTHSMTGSKAIGTPVFEAEGRLAEMLKIC